MNSEDLRQLRPPQVLESYPEALKNALRSLERASDQNEAFGAANAVQEALEFLLTYFTSVATGLLIKLEPGRPEVNALASNVDSLLQMERLLRFSLSSLESSNHHAPLKVRRVFFLNARSNLPFSHTRWLRISGSVDPGLVELSQWSLDLEEIRANQDEARARHEAVRYNDLLKTWLEGAQPFFDYWIHDYGADRVTLVAEGFEFSLEPSLPAKYLPEGTRSRIHFDLPRPSTQRLAPPSLEMSLPLPLDVKDQLRDDLKKDLKKVMEPEISRLVQFKEWIGRPEVEIQHPFADMISARLEYLSERSDTVPDQLFEQLSPDHWDVPASQAPAAPWSADEVEAFEKLLTTTYPHVEERFLPQRAVQNVHRFLNSQVQGYVLVEGDRGSGKTLLCRALTPVVRTARLGEIPALYLPIRARLQADCQTFIEQLNEHLRVRPRPGRRSFSALDHHVIKHLNIRFPAQARAARFAAYLSELYLINETPFLLILDGLDEAFEGLGGQASLSDYLPAELPDGVYIMATYRPVGLSARGQNRVDRLRERSSLVIELDPASEDYQVALQEHLGSEEWTQEQDEALRQRAQGMIGMTRHLSDLLRSGLVSHPRDLPAAEDYYEFTLAILEERFGQRFLQLFLLLATSDEPVPASEFSSFGIGREDALELVHNLPSFFYCFDLENPGMSLSHGVLKHHLQESYFTLYAEICEQLARTTLKRLSELEDPVGQAHLRRDQLSLALRRLFSWTLDSQNHQLFAEVAESDALRAVRTAVFAELEESGLFHRKTTILDAFRQILAALVERFGRQEFREELAWAHSSRGLAYLHLGHFERALGDIERAIHHFTHLVETEGMFKLRNGLAAAYNRRSEACRFLGQWGSALSDAKAAVEQYQIVVEEQEREELKALLALAIHNRGQVYRARREYEAALRDFDEAVDIYSELVDVHQHRKLRRELAQAHHSRCCLLLDLEQANEALVEGSAAIELMEQLVHDEAYESLRNDLASVYNDRAAVYHRTNRFELADQDYSSAINIRNYLVAEGRLDVRTDLARTYTNRGLCLVARRENGRALDCYARAIEILNRLIDTEMREDLYAARAFAKVCRARLQSQQGDQEKAHFDFEQAAGDYRLAVVSGDDEALVDLAGSLSHLAGSHLSRGDYPAALRNSSRAIEIYEGELDTPVAKKCTHERGVAHRTRAKALEKNGQETQAFDEYEAAISLYTRLLEAEGRKDLAEELAHLHLRKGEVALGLKDAQTTIRDTSRALSLFSNLKPAPGREAIILRGRAEATAVRSRAYEVLNSEDAALDDSSASMELFRRIVADRPTESEFDILADVAARRGRLLSRMGDSRQACLDFDFALQMLDNMEDQLTTEERLFRRADVLLERSETYLQMGQPHSAVRDLVEAYASGRLSESEPRMKTVDRAVKALKVQALAQMRDEDYRNAVNGYHHLVELLSALGVQQQERYKEELAQSLSNRGWARLRLDQPEDALDDFDEALSLLEELAGENIKSLLGKTSLNRAAALEAMGFPDSALEAYNLAVDTLEECQNQEGHLAGALSSRSRLVEDPEEAYADLERAINIFEKLGQTRALSTLKQRQVELLLQRPETGKGSLLDRALAAYRGLDDPVRANELLELLGQRFEKLDDADEAALAALTEVFGLLTAQIEEGGAPAGSSLSLLLRQTKKHFRAEPVELERLLSAAESLCVAILRAGLGGLSDFPGMLLGWNKTLPEEQGHRHLHLLALAAAFCGQEVIEHGDSGIPRLVRCLLWTGKAIGESGKAPPFLDVLSPVFELLLGRIEMAEISSQAELELNNAARLWLSLPASILAKANISRAIVSRLRRW